MKDEIADCISYAENVIVATTSPAHSSLPLNDDFRMDLMVRDVLTEGLLGMR